MPSKAVRVFAGWVSILLLMVLSGPMAFAQRQTVPLNGTWEIDDSVAADQPPQVYTHTVPVPGLAHSARPAFADVDQFSGGVSHQQRNWFWYRRKFTASAKHEVAILKVSKAQFGIEVYLNGTLLGTHWPCFTAAYFDASTPHAYLCTGRKPAGAIIVTLHQGPGPLPAMPREKPSPQPRPA